MPVRDRGNIIAFAFNDYSPMFSLKELREIAINLEKKYQIEFPAFLKDLKKHNASTFSQVIKT